MAWMSLISTFYCIIYWQSSLFIFLFNAVMTDCLLALSDSSWSTTSLSALLINYSWMSLWFLNITYYYSLSVLLFYYSLNFYILFWRSVNSALNWLWFTLLSMSPLISSRLTLVSKCLYNSCCSTNLLRMVYNSYLSTLESKRS